MSPVSPVGATGPAAVVVLAAGEGKRMRSSTPKVLHEVAGRSLIAHVLHSARALDPSHLIVVVGHGREAVASHVRGADAAAETVVQAEQLGTGHAVRLALQAHPDLEGVVVVVSGDSPLLSADTLAALVSRHADDRAAATVVTAVLTDPTGYGRIVRDDDGDVAAIVEHRDADAEVLALAEVNSGVFAFDARELRSALTAVGRDNSQGEEYLTDVVGLLVAEGRTVSSLVVRDPLEVLGVNDRAQLAAVSAHMRDRVVGGWMRAGVTIADPATTWIDVTVLLGPDVTLLPGTQLYGTTAISSGATVGPDSTLRDVVVDEGATVVRSHLEAAEIGADAVVGPYSYVRPGTVLGAGAKIGAYVETKNARIGDGSKVPHLSYVGDADIGEGSNIGAATVFVNYDGVDKHRTVVGDHVRIGSDTMLLAPVTIGDGAYTAAGSVIDSDVPPGAMGVARARQRNVEGWVARRRAGTSSAAAAEQAVHRAQSGSEDHPIPSPPSDSSEGQAE